MSEIKSPFLKDGKKTNNEYGEQPIVLGAGPGGGEGNSLNSTVRTAEVKQKSVIGDMGNASATEMKDEVGESLEIKEEGKVLRNVIISMIVLLVLALLGLLMYNLFNKSGEPANTTILKEETNVEITNFEMKGEEFKAGSIIIEQ